MRFLSMNTDIFTHLLTFAGFVVGLCAVVVRCSGIHIRPLSDHIRDLIQDLLIMASDSSTVPPSSTSRPTSPIHRSSLCLPTARKTTPARCITVKTRSCPSSWRASSCSEHTQLHRAPVVDDRRIAYHASLTELSMHSTAFDFSYS